MTGRELSEKDIVTIIDDKQMYYVIYRAGIDEAVCLVDKKSKEIKQLYSLICNDNVFDLLNDDAVVKHESKKEIEEFKQFLLSFA